MNGQSAAINEEKGIRLKIRLDFKGSKKQGKLFFGGKPIEKMAEEAREQNVSIFRNIPLQGIKIMDIDIGTDVYTVYDTLSNAEIAFAPVILDVLADSLESTMELIAREEFRTVEIISPNSLSLSKFDMERILFKISEEMKNYSSLLERKYNLR